MKSILILRHAKSDWRNASLSDFDRPLNNRGLNDAPRMGIVLKKFRAMPDLIISSPSMRTRKTVELVVQHSLYVGDIAWEDTLYGGNFYDIASALHAMPEDVTRPMVVGHNPGIEETVSLLLSLQVGGSSNHTHVRVPTAGLVYLDAHIDKWRDLKPGTCVLRWFLIPKLVKSIIK